MYKQFVEICLHLFLNHFSSIWIEITDVTAVMATVMMGITGEAGYAHILSTSDIIMGVRRSGQGEASPPGKYKIRNNYMENTKFNKIT